MAEGAHIVIRITQVGAVFPQAGDGIECLIEVVVAVVAIHLINGAPDQFGNRRAFSVANGAELAPLIVGQIDLRALLGLSPDDV